MAKAHSVCVSERKGEKKHPVDTVVQCEEYGIEGDAMPVPAGG